MGHVFGELGGIHGDARDLSQIALLVDAGGGRHVEAGGQIAAIDHRVVAHHRAFADVAVEQHAVEADEHPVTDFAGPVHYAAVGDGAVLADGDGRTGLGMDHHPVLNVGVGTDDDRLHVTAGIHFVGADHGVGADKHVLLDDHLAADDGGLVDIGGFVDNGQVTGGILADHVMSCC
ncbi:hypothetical protein D3C85_1140930 [compost metagenome]